MLRDEPLVEEPASLAQGIGQRRRVLPDMCPAPRRAGAADDAGRRDRSSSAARAHLSELHRAFWHTGLPGSNRRHRRSEAGTRFQRIPRHMN